VDAIIARNLKEFQKAKLPLMTPSQFLRSIELLPIE
jgi:hypothetical protein